MEFLKPLEITEGYVGAASSLRALCFIQRCSRGHTMCFVSLLWVFFCFFFFKKGTRKPSIWKHLIFTAVWFNWDDCSRLHEPKLNCKKVYSKQSSTGWMLRWGRHSRPSYTYTTQHSPHPLFTFPLEWDSRLKIALHSLHSGGEKPTKRAVQACKALIKHI